MKALFLSLLLSVQPFVWAQPTADRAVQVASVHPAFVSVLAARPDYRAAAYDTRNAYGIWRVQFWEAGGESIGWLDLDPSQDRVYTWAYETGLNDLETAEAARIIPEVVRTLPEIRALLSDPEALEIDVAYQEGSGLWWSRVQRGPDSVVVLLRPELLGTRSLENLQLERIVFPGVVPYEAWQSGFEANIVALAFRDPEVARALRGEKDWTTHVNPVTDALWTVAFSVGDRALASATVNLEQKTITEVVVGDP